MSCSWPTQFIVLGGAQPGTHAKESRGGTGGDHRKGGLGRGPAFAKGDWAGAHSASPFAA
jgi:hypothetical protein